MRQLRRTAQYSLEAEQAVLVTLLTSPDALYDSEVLEKLSPEDFSDRRHQAIYQAIMTCEAESKPYWDLVVLCDTLTKQGDLQKVGGREFLENLLEVDTEPDSIGAHIQIVAEKSLLRRIGRVGQRMVELASDPAAKADDVLEAAESQVFSLGDRTEAGKFVYMGESLKALEDALAVGEGSNDELVGVSTSLPTLDDLTSGFQPGQLIIIAGRPGMGKSAVALQMARHAAEVSGEHALYVSYEMTKVELLTRMVAAATEMTPKEIRRGLFTADQLKNLTNERARLAQLPFGVNDRPPTTITGLRSALRREARRRPLSLVVVDYIQLMAGSGRENRNQDLSEVSRGLKLLAGELGVPILGLSQLNRGVEVRGTDNYRPRLSDLRDSGSIEQDADIVLFVNRPAAISSGFDEKYAELILAKQRSGQAGAIIECEFWGQYTKFIDKGLLKVGPSSVSFGGGGASAPF